MALFYFLNLHQYTDSINKSSEKQTYPALSAETAAVSW